MAAAELDLLDHQPPDEVGRLAALERYDALDARREQASELFATIVKRALKVDFTAISLMDNHRLRLIGAEGTDLSQSTIEDSFSRFTIQGDGPLVVPDATKDPRFVANRYVVGEPFVRSYAGVPLRTVDGYNIGTLSVADRSPREFSPEDVDTLCILGKLVMHDLDLRQSATSDSLTGVLSRRAFKEEAAKSLAYARRHRTKLAVLVYDLDQFKKINETYGDAVGDQLLRATSEAARVELRASDLLGRIGGEEFAAVLPETDLAGAINVAEKLRIGIRNLKFPGSHPPLSITASFGVAMVNVDADDIDAALVKSEEALYEAKQSGRNRTLPWRGTTTSTTKRVFRRRVLKAGQLVFNNRHSTINCTVRALWENGAEVDVSTTEGIPSEIEFAIRSDDLDTKARVTIRREASLELEFIAA